jgi:asparagine synthase (glutamine-hydrolysing)
MSGIVGLWRLEGQPVARTELVRMAESLAHRGPDGGGAWNDGCVGLAHQMLRTTPESFRECLPLASATGDLVLTADARIDNREELIAGLGLPDRPSEEISDGGLILGAYEKWGEDCPEKLLGDFAFAIWDGRRRTLFCARDHVGVKPFYYYGSPRVFAFASEIKALLSLGAVPRQLNEVRVADHLVGSFADRTITFYRDIFRLPAAHSMTVTAGAIRIRPYWSLDPSREFRLRSDQEYAEAFREIFMSAVRCRLRSAFPAGSLLSGGLDSSSIVCAARALMGGRKTSLHTFSAIFPDLPEADLRRIDERKFVQAVLAKGGLAPHYVRADRLSPLADLDRVLWHQDEAVLAPNLYLHWALYGAARQHGVRVLLDGIDGDTTVSHGLEYLADLAGTGRWKMLVTEATALSANSPSSFFSPRRILWEYGFKPLVPEAVAQLWRFARRPTRAHWAAWAVINPTFARRVGMAERARALRGNGSAGGRLSRQVHWHGLTSGLIPAALEMADRASAAFSLEARYPFFDRRLMEFCLALPADQKLSGGWTRVTMRRAMADILPEAVRWRAGKATLAPNFCRRLLEADRPLLDDVILKDPRAIEEYVDIAALRAAYDRYRSQPLAEDGALCVYGAVTMGVWLQQTGLGVREDRLCVK